MKTITKTTNVVSLLVAITTIFALSTGSALAYYGGGYGQSSYNQPSQYQSAQSAYQQPQYGYSYRNELLGLVQSNLNLINRLTYIAPPIHYYFFQYYSPFSYYGW